MKRILIGLVGLAAFVGSLWTGWTFRASNSLSIDLDLIWIRIPNVELWWVLLVAMGLGAALLLLLISFPWMRRSLLLRKYRSTIRRLEKEVHELRSLPLVGSEPGGETLDPAQLGGAKKKSERSFFRKKKPGTNEHTPIEDLTETESVVPAAASEKN